MYDDNDDLAEIIEAQVDRYSDDEDLTPGEARFKAKNNANKTARYDEEELFDDASKY